MTQSSSSNTENFSQSLEEKSDLNVVKNSVADKSYFKDAFDWYVFRYVTPVCDRTLLIFGAIVSAIVLFFLIQMINSAFPLVEQIPIFVRAKDQSLYFPYIEDLKPKVGEANYDADIKTVDEAIAKYLLLVYVKDREGFDFSKAEVEDVNKKFNHIKNTSSDDEFGVYRLLMDKDNPTSPINFFGQDVVKSITIESFKFIRKDKKDFLEGVKNFFSNDIPSQAEIKFLATTTTTTLDGVSDIKQRYLAKVNFAFIGVDKDEKSDLKFRVNSYKLFEIK